MASLSEKDPLGCPLCSVLSFPDFSPLFEMLMQNMASLPKRMNLHTTFVIWFPGLEPQLPPPAPCPPSHPYFPAALLDTFFLLGMAFQVPQQLPNQLD